MDNELSLVDIAKQATPAKCRREISFLDKLPADHQKLLLELRAAYRGGELSQDWSAGNLISEVIEPAGIKLGISVQTFRRWLRHG